MAEPLDPSDPAYWMLAKGKIDPTWRSTPEVYQEGCYICRDPEYALMGLPLCKPCPMCQRQGTGDGHIAADDTVCSVCGYDAQEAWEAAQAAAGGSRGAPEVEVVLNEVGEQTLGEIRSTMKQRLLRSHEQRRHPEESDD
jgi:hypothetical protein